MLGWLNQPPMPWQRHVLDVAGELVEDERGRMVPAYRTVVVTVPRQNGKTTLVLGFELDRAITWGSPQRVIYSAQTGQDARTKLLEDQVPLIEAAPKIMAFVDRINRSKGEESVRFKTGSRIGLMASSKAAGHGKTVGLGVLDEAFDDVDDTREQALIPAQLTLADAQLLIVSTKGTEASVFLNRKITLGRELVGEDSGSGTAYFEWSADENADPDDPEVWRSCMPALGHTITEATVREARRQMSDSEFRRAMLNITDKRSDDRPIPMPVWERVQDPGADPVGGLVIGLDISPDRASGAIVVADPSGRCELVEHRDGAAWCRERVLELVGRWGGRVALDAKGPAGSEEEPLRAAGVDVVAFNAEHMADACGRLLDRVADPKIRVRPHPALDEAVEAAVRRHSGDVWVWGRKSATADVAPLVALTVAVDAAMSTPTPVDLATQVL